MSWAAGSMYSAGAPKPKSMKMTIALQMLIGGAGLAAAGLFSGELVTLQPQQFAWETWAVLGYLILFGSIIGFSAYSWLLKNVRPSLVGTYAYVNPVVAIFLGSVIAGETLTTRDIVAAAVILSGVFLISSAKSKHQQQPEAVEQARGQIDAEVQACVENK